MILIIIIMNDYEDNDEDHDDSRLLYVHTYLIHIYPPFNIVQHGYDDFDDDTRQYASVYKLHKINLKNTLLLFHKLQR